MTTTQAPDAAVLMYILCVCVCVFRSRLLLLRPLRGLADVCLFQRISYSLVMMMVLLCQPGEQRIKDFQKLFFCGGWVDGMSRGHEGR